MFEKPSFTPPIPQRLTSDNLKNENQTLESRPPLPPPVMPWLTSDTLKSEDQTLESRPPLPPPIQLWLASDKLKSEDQTLTLRPPLPPPIPIRLDRGQQNGYLYKKKGNGKKLYFVHIFQINYIFLFLKR